MTEVSYGQFFDALEEMNFPRSDSNANFEESAQPKRVRSLKKMNPSLVENFFKAFERVNFSQYESSESLISMASQSSLSSLQSEKDLGPETFVDAVQSLTFNQFESSASLKNMDKPNTKTADVQMDIFPVAFVRDFIKAFDDFMMNYSSED